MALYTVIHEDYSVDVYRTQKAVCAAFVLDPFCLENSDHIDGEPVIATAKDIAKALRSEGEVRLYPVDGGDWEYKIVKQTHIR